MLTKSHIKLQYKSRVLTDSKKFLIHLRESICQVVVSWQNLKFIMDKKISFNMKSTGLNMKVIPLSSLQNTIIIDTIIISHHQLEKFTQQTSLQLAFRGHLTICRLLCIKNTIPNTDQEKASKEMTLIDLAHLVIFQILLYKVDILFKDKDRDLTIINIVLIIILTCHRNHPINTYLFKGLKGMMV